MNGTYSEKLVTGGELKVSKNEWSIQYYFPGPDRRYNGTFVIIRGDKIQDYIDAWKKNYNEYQELKRSIPNGGTFIKKALLDMTIHVGGFADGVCLKEYHMKVNSIEKLNDVINDYVYAQNTAEKVMNLLKQM